MKMMNQIESDKAGVVKPILCQDGDTIEFDDPPLSSNNEAGGPCKKNPHCQPWWEIALRILRACMRTWDQSSRRSLHGRP